MKTKILHSRPTPTDDLNYVNKHYDETRIMKYSRLGQVIKGKHRYTGETCVLRLFDKQAIIVQGSTLEALFQHINPVLGEARHH